MLMRIRGRRSEDRRYGKPPVPALQPLPTSSVNKRVSLGQPRQLHHFVDLHVDTAKYDLDSLFFCGTRQVFEGTQSALVYVLHKEEVQKGFRAGALEVLRDGQQAFRDALTIDNKAEWCNRGTHAHTSFSSGGSWVAVSFCGLRRPR